MEKPFRRRDLLGIRDLTAAEIVGILDTAENFSEISTREVKKVPALRGKTVINLFFENSTRTRTSFELAAKRLSADAVNISVASSSVTKGETLLDTALNLDAMAVVSGADQRQLRPGETIRRLPHVHRLGPGHFTRRK